MTLPTDPLFSQQWYLQNNNPNGKDLNVVDAWNYGYTGLGVGIAVIDDAVQRTHPDLDGRYSRAKDHDYDNNDTDPSGNSQDSHGTAVAGIIGANANNGIGGVGVAYDATIWGAQVSRFVTNNFIQQLTTAINDASGRSSGFSLNREADIVNISLGTMAGGNFFDQSLNSSLMATLNRAIGGAVAVGRDGLGTILVKSAGNERDDNADTNASSWNANPRTISVAAVDQDGFVSDYSTHGASTLVAAFGSPRGNNGEIVTTDRTGREGYNAFSDYTTSFNGTSAAAPMVSGVVALMLEANPSLGWRDVQDILAYSARHVGTAIGAGTSGDEEYAWDFNGADNWNGGGLHFSNDYGFGLVDAKAAVRMAETWNSTPHTTANASYVIIDVLNSTTTISNRGSSFQGVISSKLDIESVEVDINFPRWDDLGDLELRLISPDGTSSILIDNTGENNGNRSGGFGSGRWKFSSQEFRGENTAGTWTVQLFDADSTTVSPITINDIDIRFSGKAFSNDDIFVFTEEYSNYAGRFGHATAINGGIGIDTINAAAVDANTTINLTTGTGIIDGVRVTTSGIETIITGDGNDSLQGNRASNTLRGMRGNDVINADAGSDIVDAGLGNDRVVDNDGINSDNHNGGGGIDTIDYSPLRLNRVTIDLSKSTSTVLNGNTETIKGFENVEDSQGSGTIIGAANNNRLDGNNGDDIIYGQGGVDVLIGGNGDDVLDSDTLVTVDTLGDTLDGGAGNDHLTGEAGNDRLFGGTGSDLLNGQAGGDTLLGGSGNDTLFGGSHSDTLNGYGGSIGEYDILTGDNQRNRPNVKNTNDGGDRFILGDASSIFYLGQGFATIKDFFGDEGDRLQLNGRLSDYSMRLGQQSGTTAQDTLIYRQSDLIAVVEDNTSISKTQDLMFV